jgi:hypothetical protein
LGHPNTISWTDWPARRQPRRAAFAVLVILVGTGAVAALDPWLGFVGALLLMTATAEVLLPTRFGLNDDGVTIANPLRRAHRSWDRFGSYRQTEEGFFLIGAARSPLLRRRVSLTLRCENHMDAVTQALRHYLGEACA